MAILLTGHTGMLGRALAQQLEPDYPLLKPGRDQFDLTDPATIHYYLEQHRPEQILHLAALTNVDQCQREPTLAFQVNSQATQTLVAYCQRYQVPLLFMSSIAVFNGRKESPYLESDRPEPINSYGCSKWQAEQAVATLPNHLIVRSGWLFGGGAADKKFVAQMIALARSRPELAVVADKIGSPTAVTDLAVGLKQLLDQRANGLYHLVNDGPPISRYELAVQIMQMAGLATVIRPVTSDHFPHLAPRPAMEAAASQKAPPILPPWPQSLANYVQSLST